MRTDVPPPADLAAEQSVLRAWVSDTEFRRAWKPEPELFFGGMHRTIAEIMARRAGAKRFGEHTLIGELQRAGQLKGEVTRDTVLNAVGGPLVADPWNDVERIRELAALRALKYELAKTHDSITTDTRLHTIQGRVRAAEAASVEAMGIKLLTAKDLAHSVSKHLESRRPISYCTTCYRRIDAVTGGIRPGDAWVLRADTSWGKSTYATAVIDENIDRGRRVLLVTNEDPAEMYGRRIACRRASVRYSLLRDRRLDQFELGRVQRQIIGLEQSASLWVVNAVGKSIERITGIIRSAIRIHRLNLVVLDYAQKLWAEAKTENRERALVYCAERFADTCKTDNVASLLLSQMTVNAQGENRTKGAGAIKDNAETLLEGRTENRAGIITKTIRCVKVKEGRAGGEFEVEWDDNSASFVADVPRELGLPDNDEE